MTNLTGEMRESLLNSVLLNRRSKGVTRSAHVDWMSTIRARGFDMRMSKVEVFRFFQLVVKVTILRYKTLHFAAVTALGGDHGSRPCYGDHRNIPF